MLGQFDLVGVQAAKSIGASEDLWGSSLKVHMRVLKNGISRFCWSERAAVVITRMTALWGCTRHSPVSENRQTCILGTLSLGLDTSGRHVRVCVGSIHFSNRPFIGDIWFKVSHYKGISTRELLLLWAWGFWSLWPKQGVC